MDRVLTFLRRQAFGIAVLACAVTVFAFTSAFKEWGGVTLSVTMTCCSTLLSPFVTPFAMKVLAGRFVEIDAMKMMVEIQKVVIVPIAAGGVVHALFSPCAQGEILA